MAAPAGALGNETLLGVDHGGDVAEPRAGAGPAHCRGEEATGTGEAAGGGRDQEEAVVCQLQEGGHLPLLLEHQLL